LFTAFGDAPARRFRVLPVWILLAAVRGAGLSAAWKFGHVCSFETGGPVRSIALPGGRAEANSMDRGARHGLRPALELARPLGIRIGILCLLAVGAVGVRAEPAADSLVALPALLPLRLLLLGLLPLLSSLLHLLHQALLQDLMQQGMLLHDLARQQWML
jgi:hypothetical protein